MKSILVCVLMLVAASPCVADRPIDGGRMWLNGSLILSYRAGDMYGNKDHSLVRIEPSVGVFALSHVLVGVTADVQLTSDNAPAQRETWFVGPIVGFYLDPAPARESLPGAFYPFVRGFYLWGQAERWEFESARRVGGEAGMAIMVSGSVGIEILGRYSHDTFSNWRGTSVYAPYKSAQAIEWEDATGSTLLIGISFSAYL